MADLFGDSSLFSEFERERESGGSFIAYNKDEHGREDKSKIVFQFEESDSEECSADEDTEENSNLSKKGLTDSESQSSTLDNESRVPPLTENKDYSETLTSKVNDVNHCDSTVYSHSEKVTMFQLQHQRDKLRKFTRLIDSTRHVPDFQSPALQVMYQNNEFSRKYRGKIEWFIRQLIYEDAQSPYENLPRLDLEASQLTCVDINDDLPPQLRNEKMWTAHAILGCTQFHRSFAVDILGWPLIQRNAAISPGWDIPTFMLAYTEFLPIEEDSDVGSRKSSGRPKATCFNCGGDHIIAACKEKKDQKKINENMRIFREKNASSSTISGHASTNTRYHADNDPRFVKFKPGVISEDLRRALGLGSRQMPLHVYRMRQQGYPPGWLKEAEVNESGISMFGKHGKEISVKGDMLEDGELDQDKREEVEYDADKIVEYPGFTVAAPDGCIDEHRELGMPPLQEHQLKETLKKYMTGKQKGKKRKLSEEGDRPRKTARLDMTSDAMDLEEGGEPSILASSFISLIPGVPSGLPESPQSPDSSPPLPMETPPSRPPLPVGTPPVTPRTTPGVFKKPRLYPTPGRSTPPPLPPGGTPPNPQPPLPAEDTPTGRVRRQSSEGNASDSLEYLEGEYKTLMNQLAVGDDTGLTENDVQVVDSVPATEASEDMNAESVSTSANTSILDSPSVCSPTSEIRLTHKSSSISKEYGTPILQKTVSASSLPDRDKFAVGAEDHLLFENLPESTGSFKKMRSLIQKIRQSITRKKK